MEMVGQKNTGKMHNNSARVRSVKLIYVKRNDGSFPAFYTAQ
jgi:hypothetical protein